MTKKTVHYIGEPVKLSDRYLVTPTNHPSTSNYREALTSRIVREVDEFGTFETENSIYMLANYGGTDD